MTTHTESTGSQARFAPPTAEVADIATTAEDRLANRGTRFVAVMLDGIIQGALLVLVSKLTPWNLFAPGEGFAEQAMGLLISLAVFLLVNGVLLVQRGQTLGKLITGVRIVRPDGSRASPLRLIGLRYGLGWATMLVPVVGMVYGLVDSLFIFRADRRCLHDLIAGTIVVKV